MLFRYNDKIFSLSIPLPLTVNKFMTPVMINNEPMKKECFNSDWEQLANNMLKTEVTEINQSLINSQCQFL